MLSLLVFCIFQVAGVFGQTCDPTQVTGPNIIGCPTGEVSDSSGNCCPSSALLTTTAAATTTTLATTIVTVAGGGSTQIAVTASSTASAATVSSTTCADLLNPSTGVSDCPARAALCNDATYYTVMTQQCPRTCGRCNSTTASTSCVDLVNPSTGVSDCPARASLCNDATYYTVMTQQCPRTCGRCNSTTSTTTSSSTCADLLNPSTGVSDCPSRAALCTNSAYLALMRVQCPLTCGYCSSTASTATSSSSTVTSSTCADLVNSATGTSDCPSLVSYCTNSAYATLMRAQCPLTCGYCSG